MAVVEDQKEVQKNFPLEPLSEPLGDSSESLSSNSVNEVNPTFFEEDALSANTLRLSGLEGFFSAAIRDCTFSECVGEILDVFLRVVRSEAGSILEVDKKNQTLFFRAATGLGSEGLLNFSVPIGQGIAGHVAESRMPLTVDHVPENKLHLESIAKTIGFEVRNLVAIPLIIRNQTYGVLELLNRIGEPNYTPADLETLNYLAQFASKLIELRMVIAWVKAGGNMGGVDNDIK